MAKYKQDVTEAPVDVWVVNQDGRVVAVNVGTIQHEYAETGNQGWRRATPDQIAEAQLKAEEDSKKAVADMEREQAARNFGRRGPMREAEKPVVAQKETLKR